MTKVNVATKFIKIFEPKNELWKSKNQKPYIIGGISFAIGLCTSAIKIFLFGHSWATIILDGTISASGAFGAFAITYLWFLEEYWSYTISTVMTNLPADFSSNDKKMDGLKRIGQEVVMPLVEKFIEDNQIVERLDVIYFQNSKKINGFLVKNLGVHIPRKSQGNMKEFLIDIFNQIKNEKTKAFITTTVFVLKTCYELVGQNSDYISNLYTKILSNFPLNEYLNFYNKKNSKPKEITQIFPSKNLIMINQ